MCIFKCRWIEFDNQLDFVIWCFFSDFKCFVKKYFMVENVEFYKKKSVLYKLYNVIDISMIV